MDNQAKLIHDLKESNLKMKILIQMFSHSENDESSKSHMDQFEEEMIKSQALLDQVRELSPR